MKVLILGSGGREHAVAWKLKSDDPSIQLTAAPGNPGIEELGRCVRVNPTDVAAVVSLANDVRPDLVFVGPEAPLAAGVVDALEAVGIRSFGPSQQAAQLESSKRFSKRIMLEHGVPTAGASFHHDVPEAKAAVRVTGAPVVIKASGLAGGKGVVVASTVDEADRAIEAMLVGGAFGRAGAELLVEEYMEGEEVSVFAICDGTCHVLLPPAQDHKRLRNGDVGPNTGGMGAYSPVSVASPAVLQSVSDRIIEPILHAMSASGAPFRGLLYCGIMLTEHGPKVVEFNCRFGDPETQVVLPVMTAELLPLLMRASEPKGLGASSDLSLAGASAVTTVVAAPGYPESPVTGAPVLLPETPEHVMIFHAGTARGPGHGLVSAGGRVLAVTAMSDDFEEACLESRRWAATVGLRDAQYRTDIGWREMARRARTPGN